LLLRIRFERQLALHVWSPPGPVVADLADRGVGDKLPQNSFDLQLALQRRRPWCCRRRGLASVLVFDAVALLLGLAVLAAAVAALLATPPSRGCRARRRELADRGVDDMVPQTSRDLRLLLQPSPSWVLPSSRPHRPPCR
jgi:hypothetical protein